MYCMFGRLVVVVDDQGRFVAVCVYHRLEGKRTLDVLWRTAGPTMAEIETLHVRWTGPLPAVGDYLKSRTTRARIAYKIVADPRETNRIPPHRDEEEMIKIDVKAVKVDLPLPEDARVFPWRWDPRFKLTGVVNV